MSSAANDNIYALKRAIDDDDAQQLEDLLHKQTRRERVDLPLHCVVDKLFPEFQGRTCLHRACERGKQKCCEKLLVGSCFC